MNKLLTAGILFLFSLNALALECTGTVTGMVSNPSLCDGFASYTTSENPNYWLCSDSEKSDALLLLAFSLQEPVKTVINGAGNCSSIAQHYLVIQAVTMLPIGTALPSTSYEVDYLVVGGGGGGGGSVDTGGGGGGGGNWSGSASYGGANGGSGVVILKIPVNKYTGVTTGSPTVTESGGYKYVKFTASGSYSG